MSEHRAHIAWRREGAGFDYASFSRDHRWRLGSGATLDASAAPEYRGPNSAGGVDPEEALVASIASCHMLTFLAVAARRRLIVDRYEDEAVGVLGKNAEGRLAMTRVVLSPRIGFAGGTPPTDELDRLHALAHRNCFIANSVRCEVRVERPPTE